MTESIYFVPGAMNCPTPLTALLGKVSGFLCPAQTKSKLVLGVPGDLRLLELYVSLCVFCFPAYPSADSAEMARMPVEQASSSRAAIVGLTNHS